MRLAFYIPLVFFSTFGRLATLTSQQVLGNYEVVTWKTEYQTTSHKRSEIRRLYHVARSMVNINPMYPVRGTQGVLAVIVLGLMAYGLSSHSSIRLDC